MILGRLALALCLLASGASAQELLLQFSAAQTVPQATLFLDFVNNIGFNGTTFASPTSLIAVTRAQPVNTTDLTPLSPPGYAYQTFAASTPRTTLGLGLLIEGTRTNLLINATAPAIQSPSLAASTVYTLWMNGSGSVAVTPGTTCGGGTASQGSPLTFTTTATAGTCTVTPTGTVNAFQLEAGAFGTSLIVTAAASAARNVDVVTVTSPPAPGSAYSFRVSSTFIGFSTTANQGTVQWDDGTATNRTQMFRFITNGPMALGGSVGLGSLNNAMAAQAGSLVHHATAQTANSQVSNAFAGNTAFSGATFTPFAAFTTLRLGGNSVANSQPCYCYIADVTLWPTTALASSQLQQITRQ